MSARPAEQFKGHERPDWYVVLLAWVLMFCAPGCHLIVPDVSHQPQVQNPFPQLSNVAVAPFFNQSDEPSLDGREVAMAYFSELQAIPGFVIVPVGVVEEAIIRHRVDLSGPYGPSESRRLARLLGVDVVVIGTVTDFSPFYPPRCAMRVEWYAANPGFHEIPPGYGLPWATTEEEYVPPPLVYEAEMALARAQLATQSPDCTAVEEEIAPPTLAPTGAPTLLPANTPDQTEKLDTMEENADDAAPATDEAPLEEATEQLPAPPTDSSVNNGSREALVALAQHRAGDGAKFEEQPELDVGISLAAVTSASSETIIPSDNSGTIDPYGKLPPNWPSELGFIPSPPCSTRPPCIINDGPVMTHTRIYHGNDMRFTAALETYVYFRNDERFGGWQTYLRRSDDFIRFCCHLHISEMLSARGGAGETRVVCEWPTSR